jgi:hypothetical protein
MRSTTLATIAAVALGALSPAAALADSASGSGAAFAVRVGPEYLTIFTTFQGNQAIVHVRNVGQQVATVTVAPQCESSACGVASTFTVKPVATAGDAGEDRAVALPEAARSFSWTVSV